MVRAAHERTTLFHVGCIVWLVASGWLCVKGLGILAFSFSALLALWVFGLREKFASEESPSAYSVFNKGGQAILGGFTGEQLEGQLRGGNQTLPTNKENKASADAPLVSISAKEKPVHANEKVKRRSAAAAAAERRLQQQKEQG